MYARSLFRRVAWPVAATVSRGLTVRSLHASARTLVDNTPRRPDPRLTQREWTRSDATLQIEVPEQQLKRLLGANAVATPHVVIYNLPNAVSQRDLQHLVHRAKLTEADVESSVIDRSRNALAPMRRARISFTDKTKGSMFVMGVHGSLLNGQRLRVRLAREPELSEQESVAGASGRSVLIVGMPWNTLPGEVYKMLSDFSVSDTFEPVITMLPSHNQTTTRRFVVQMETEEAAHILANSLHNTTYARNAADKFPLKADVVY